MKTLIFPPEDTTAALAPDDEPSLSNALWIIGGIILFAAAIFAFILAHPV